MIAVHAKPHSREVQMLCELPSEERPDVQDFLLEPGVWETKQGRRLKNETLMFLASCGRVVVLRSWPSSCRRPPARRLTMECCAVVAECCWWPVHPVRKKIKIKSALQGPGLDSGFYRPVKLSPRAGLDKILFNVGFTLCCWGPSLKSSRFNDLMHNIFNC